MMKFYHRRTFRIAILICYFSVLCLILIPYNFPKCYNSISNIASEYSIIFNSNSSFEAKIKSIPWQEYDAAVNSNDTGKVQYISELLLRKLIPFLAKSPAVPINTTCFPPPLFIPNHSNCRELKRPRRIGVLLQLGFDLDALEIHLNELEGIVDKFFILESIQSHSSFAKQKPLLWDMVKGQERFSPFLKSIVHFVVDDEYLPQVKSDGDIWQRERLQELLRWRKFLQWNYETKFFTDVDMLGFGDTDEVPHRNNIFFLKNCDVDVSPIDIGIWFPMEGITDALHSNQAIKGHPYTLGDPSYWTLERAMQEYNMNDEGKPTFPSRMRGKSRTYLLGGMHLSRYSYPPLRFVKLLTATEANMQFIKSIIEAGEHYMNDRFGEANAMLNFIGPVSRSRILTLDVFKRDNKSEAEAIVKLPWFYDCNRERYPAFEGGGA